MLSEERGRKGEKKGSRKWPGESRGGRDGKMAGEKKETMVVRKRPSDGGRWKAVSKGVRDGDTN